MATTTIKAIELPNGDIANITDKTSGYVATDATTSAHGLMSASDKTKLNGIASGAEVNQNAFSNVAIGASTISADSKTDTLTLVGGANITLTPDATNDKITILLDDTVDTGEVIATDVQAGNLIVNGSARFLNTINGDISGNAATATRVGTDLKIQLNGGTTEGTNQFTYNGSTAKSLNITKSSVGLGNVENKSSATIRGELTSSDVTTALGFTPYNAASAGTAAGKNYTTSVTSGSADLVTSGAVWTAIDNLPEPMIFKGSLGIGGTITSLPTASSANQGWTYKVITAGTYASQTAKVGDTFVSDGSAWVLIPSGDEPSGTVTSITLKAGTGISLDVDNTAITTSGTRTITNTGVRETTINGNYLRVNTGGTNADLTIPYATKATQDSDGNAINTTYLKLSGGTVTGQTTFNKSIHDAGGQTIFAGGATSSAWYKITLATNGITPPSSQQWYMCSMTIHVGGSYGSAAKGIIELSYYIHWTGSAFQATNVYAMGVGNNLQNVVLYYKLTDPFVIYVNVASSYTSLWVDKVSYRDSSYGYRTNETKVEICDAITTTDYSTIPIAKVYSTNGNNIFLNNSTFPSSNNSYNLGDPSYKWANVYATNFRGNNITLSTTSGISYEGTKNTYQMIRFIDNTNDTYGNGIAIGGGGQTIIGGGESAGVMVSNAGTSGEKIMYVGNDQNVVIFTGLQNGWDSKKTFTFDTAGALTATKFIGALQGNADTATTATTATNLNGFTNTTNAATAIDLATQNGHVYVSGTSGIYGITDGAAFVQAYSTSWVAQIYQDYRTGQIALRGRNNGTWQAWRKVLDSSNYTDYTVKKDGTGASGTWGISISGNATTATSATTASKLGSSNVGSATNPIYLSSGTATVCTYSLNKTVPSDAVFTDTKNTAGSTDTSSKIYLIGATSQAANPQTYSQDTAYVGTDGCLYSGGSKVLTAHQDISGKVSKTGDTMTGCLSITSANSSWAEGIRINRGNGGYCSFVMGGAANSTSGTGDNVWWLGCNPSAYSHKWFVAHNGSTQTGTYFYVDSSTQQSPHFRVGGDLAVGSKTTASKSCTLRYNDTTSSIDFIFTT